MAASDGGGNQTTLFGTFMATEVDIDTSDSLVRSNGLNGYSNGYGMASNGLTTSSPTNGVSPSAEGVTSSLPDWLQEKVDKPSLDVPMPTENGGYTHTSASKAKISAASAGPPKVAIDRRLFILASFVLFSSRLFAVSAVSRLRTFYRISFDFSCGWRTRRAARSTRTRCR